MVLSPEAASECSKDAPEKPVRSLSQSTSSHLQRDNSLPTENGNINNCPVQIKVYRDNSSDEVVKQPSYVSLARCISGYTLLTTYDSKQREGFRSRDISPARIPQPVPLGMNSSYQGRNSSFSSSSNNSENQQQIKSPLSPSADNTTVINSPSMNTTVTNNHQSITTSIESSMDSKNCTVHSETTSFVLQRVERLYGPGALAQGFYARHSSRRSLISHDDHSKSNGSPNISNSNNINGNSNGIDNSAEDALPVLKLLRPEFRAQLSVARHKVRSPSIDKIDGTSSPRREHIIPITLESSKETPNIVPEKNGDHLSGVQEKDGHYYLKVVHNEMGVLQRLADDLQAELSSGKVPEELDGQLRSAIGKARLLVAEKLRQFEGLCRKNISQDLTDNFRTTDEDLAGFWDMVFIQIDSVHKEFDNIAMLRDNGWKQITPKTSAVVPKITSVGKPQRRDMSGLTTNALCKNIASSTNNSNKTNKVKDARDEARRKLLQERKMAMKKNMSAASNQDQVFIS